jgi:hypothetical protein
MRGALAKIFTIWGESISSWHASTQNPPTGRPNTGGGPGEVPQGGEGLPPGAEGEGPDHRWQPPDARTTRHQRGRRYRGALRKQYNLASQ